MPITKIHIDNLESFIAKVTTTVLEDEEPDFILLYRGQRDSSWDLLPKIARNKLGSAFLKEEKEKTR